MKILNALIAIVITLGLFLILYSVASAEQPRDRILTINIDKATLTWNNLEGKKTTYTIDLRKRVMLKDNKHPEGISEEEAIKVIMNLIGIEAYLLDSEEWYKSPSAYENNQRKKVTPKPNIDRIAFAHN